MKISLLLTGNELMSGDTIDSNSAYIAQSLKELGLVPFIKQVVGDNLALLTESIQQLAQNSDVLIVNGGLGPTVDDLTSLALSQAIDSPIAQNQQALLKLQEWAQRYDFVLTESNLKQADLPKVCQIIDNPNGSAAGFYAEHNNCLIICTPGVPSEFKPMVDNHVLDLIRQQGHIQIKQQITRYRLFGITESGLQDTINAQFSDWPAEVDLGFRVQMPILEVKIITKGEQHQKLNLQWSKRFYDYFSDYIVGKDNTRLTQALNQALLKTNKKLVAAESCTGGLIASGVTSEAGSSACFIGGIVSYSNQMKMDLLNVKQQTLQEYGAVSEQTVIEMVQGALQTTDADIAVAVSGVAGPDGGSKEKPVGTIWLAWGGADNIKTRHFYLPRARRSIQALISAFTMDIVRRECLGLPTDVDYFSELKRKQARSL